MARIGVLPRLPRVRRRECEPASSREARARPAEILLLWLTRVRRSRPGATAAQVQRRRLPTRARQQYQCDRFPLLQLPTMGSMQTPVPSVRLAGYDARDRATRTQLRARKLQTLLSWRM